MSHILTHHTAAVRFHVLLHRVGDVGHPETRTGEFNALPEALLGDGDEPQRFVTHLSAGEGGGAVAVVAVYNGAHVYADNVAFLQNPGSGDAVDNLVIHRDTGRAGKSAVAQKRGLGAAASDEVAHGFVDLFGGDARLDHGASQRAGLGGDPSGFAHGLDLARRFE